ncbi:MAG TPA: hypothetical protein VKG25_14565 [Bryobacteraceae bacterium]|nr:hypothetical protein [Bryobacteraceae bacterium]
MKAAPLLLVLSSLSAQEVLEYNGKPLQFPFECTEEDTQTAGLHCSVEEPCPAFLELSSVEAVGNRLFLTGNLHGAAATFYSILITSSDAGKTWKEGYQRLRSAELDQIQFLDFETGWIAGNYISGTPRDAFLLSTHDGGSTWRLLPLFEDSRPGEIEKFYFESKTAGALLLDVRYANRYELFETRTGGDSWESRQTSVQPIRLPQERPAVSPAWRLRADAATHAYAIERAEAAAHWQKVASFLVSAGKCTQ